KRHAKFFKTPFLKEANRIAKRQHDYLVPSRILSAGQVSRMKDVELVGELMASIYQGGPINKKSALDAIIAGSSYDGRSHNRVKTDTTHTFGVVKRVFPLLPQTRFANAADFYSIYMLLWQLDHDGKVLNDPRRNRQAEKLLIELSRGVA